MLVSCLSSAAERATFVFITNVAKWPGWTLWTPSLQRGGQLGLSPQCFLPVTCVFLAAVGRAGILALLGGRAQPEEGEPQTGMGFSERKEFMKAEMPGAHKHPSVALDGTSCWPTELKCG
ncbi:uncharacterized protein LOC100936193 isoform X2 [Pongo abelii]|uniref:uncharacterized protein LOC100936193 isoform X2 n=1 Tax=Pongo abelii TaxID=9601 RepID=UPI0023E8BA5E|nr:uncharacterized protein LOC100936193 isoform X1 [Pongo abelii]